MRNPIEHEVKIWPEYYAQVSVRIKPFELRKAERDYRPGDMLLLRVFDPIAKRYTGESGRARIQTVLKDAPGLMHGYVALGIFFIGRAFVQPIEDDYDLNELH